jgi:hypothetical protein
MIKILTLILNVDKIHAIVICLAIMALTASISHPFRPVGRAGDGSVPNLSSRWAMVIALAVFAVQAVGGMSGLKAGLAQIDAARNAAGGTTGSVMSFTPDLNSAWMPMITFLVYIAVNMVGHLVSRRRAGGGGYVAQTHLSAKEEKHSLLALSGLNIAHFAIRGRGRGFLWLWWPWCAFTTIRHLCKTRNLAISASCFWTCRSLCGLMVAAFAAAFMSTIGTH